MATTEANRCRRSGVALAVKHRKYCADCIWTLSAIASEYAPIALKRRQRSKSGAGPPQETRQLMGDARSRRVAEIREWEAAHPVIPASHVFAETVPIIAHEVSGHVRPCTSCRPRSHSRLDRTASV